MIRLKNSMGFSAIEALLILIIVGFLGFAGWSVYRSQKVAHKGTNTSTAQTQANIRGLTPGPGATWNTYTNTTLGFSIKVPKQIYSQDGAYCKEDVNPVSYYDNAGTVPAGVFQDGNDFYIDATYTYQLTGEHNGDGDLTVFSGCHRVVTTAALIAQSVKHPGSFNVYVYNPLPFSVVPANSEQDVKDWIQKKFEKAVKVDSITDDKQGWQDVNLVCVTTQPYCLNFGFQLRYYPSKHRLVYLEQGQAGHLQVPGKETFYDSDVFASFSLL